MKKKITSTTKVHAAGAKATNLSGKSFTLKVLGMDNPHCVHIVSSALGKVKGILGKELLLTEKAKIVYDPTVTSRE